MIGALRYVYLSKESTRIHVLRAYYAHGEDRTGAWNLLMRERILSDTVSRYQSLADVLKDSTHQAIFN